MWLTTALLAFNLVQRRVQARASDKRLGSLILAATSLGAFVLARILSRLGAGDALSILTVVAWIGVLVLTRRRGIGVFFGPGTGATVREHLFGSPLDLEEDMEDDEGEKS